MYDLGFQHMAKILSVLLIQKGEEMMGRME
jgi:hypothetical protein